MNKSFRINIIYIVFSVLVGLILEYVVYTGSWIIPIYLLLASVDGIYNYIKMRRENKNI